MNKPAILSNPEAFVVVPVEPVGLTSEALINSARKSRERGVWSAFGFWSGPLISSDSPVVNLYARPDPDALADIVAYCAALEARLAEAEADRDLLQDVLDTRPAINAGLPESYIRWSQSIYSGDVVRAAFSPRKGNGNG